MISAPLRELHLQVGTWILATWIFLRSTIKSVKRNWLSPCYKGRKSWYTWFKVRHLALLPRDCVYWCSVQQFLWLSDQCFANQRSVWIAGASLCGCHCRLGRGGRLMDLDWKKSSIWLWFIRETRQQIDVCWFTGVHRASCCFCLDALISLTESCVDA